MRRTALVVAVPEAEPLVEGWRRRYADGARGVPAHVTLLFPFVPADRVDDGLLRDLEALLGAQRAFRFSLVRVGRFPEHAWLAPEPAAPFVALTRLLVERFPTYQPYGGQLALDELVPHLTVVTGGAELQDEVEAALTPRLPVAAEARQVTLLVENDRGRWRAGPVFALGAASRRAGRRS